MADLVAELAKFGAGWVFLAILCVAIGALFLELRASYRREVAAYKEAVDSSAAIRTAVEALTISIENRNPLTAVLGETQKATAATLERLVYATDRQDERMIEDRRVAFESLRRIEGLLERAEARDVARG